MSDHENEPKSQRFRSPPYPYLNLQQSIELAETLYKKERYNRIPVGIALKHWEYSPSSGSGARVVASLLHFGLLDGEGSKEDRKVWITDMARSILTNDKNRVAAIHEAALHPDIHQTIWYRFSLNENPLPSDDTLHYILVREMAFSDTAAASFIKEFKETLDFAQLGLNEGQVGHEQVEPESSTIQLPLIQSTEQVYPPQVSLVAEDKVAKTRDLHIPLTGRKVALIRIPKKLKAKDFEILTMWLEVMKSAELYEDDYSEDEDTDG